MHVLLTGAAGLIGSEVAALLAARGHAVTALVHRNTRLSRNDGSGIEARSFTDRCPGQGEVAIIAGDIREPGLGLPDDLHDALRSETDIVLHCAAVTGFGLGPEAYAAVNVGGTANVLAFAERRPDAAIPVLHVSTAYVCGVRIGIVPEGPVGTALFANGYETSKAEAERLVAHAQARGLPVAVARPSIVVGDWASGRIRDFDSLYLAFRMIARGLIRTLPVAPGASLDFVPIDHVARSLVDLAERIRAAAGKVFHLVSGSPVSVVDFRDVIAEYPQFSVPSLVSVDRFDPLALPAAEQRLHRHVAQYYGTYFQRAPIFLDANLRALTGRSCPPTGKAFLRRMMDHCIDLGFLDTREQDVRAVQRMSG